MGFRIEFGKRKIVNLVIKDHVIRFVQLQNTNPLIVQSYGEHYLPSGIIHEGEIRDRETLEMILDECISVWKIKNRHVRFIVPDSSVIIRKITVPNELEEDEIKGYIFMEMGSSIHLPFDNPTFDYYLLPKTDEGQEVLLFACPEETVKEYADLLEDVKLKPIAADLSSLSLFRLYHQQQPDENENVMMIQVDLQAVNICIFENRKPLIMRHILMDIDMKQWEIGDDYQKLKSYKGDENDIVRALQDVYLEVDRVRNSYNFSLNQGRKQVEKILLDGDHPWLPDIKERLIADFNIPVVGIDDQSILDKDEETVPASFHLTIGLGLREVE